MIIMMIMTALVNDDDKDFMVDLYRNYYGLVRKTVYNITHDTNVVEDLIDDTFLKLIGKIPLLRTLACCKTAAYVVYTSRNVAINFIKHRDVEKKHTYYGEDTDLAETVIDLNFGVEGMIIRQEEAMEMNEAILSLPEKEKDLLYFKYVLEMNNEELAEVLGIKSGSVRQYLTRARRKAQKLFKKEVEQHAE